MSETEPLTANRLQNADSAGQWGTKTFYYDGVGNRIEERSTPPGGALTTDVYGYGSTHNRLVQITRGASTVRTLGYDANGNQTSDSGLAGSRTYTYNKRNRLSNALIGAISWDYTYNGLEQLIVRTRVGASPADVTHYVHDIWGNVIAETDGGGPTGATGTVREYIYLPEAEIAPTFGSRTAVDRPVGVVDLVNTASPVLWFVHVDHLNRPVRMTNTAKAVVWDAVFLPWGGVHAITGSATLDARFPGQWFQLESGLHYNWHRQYDPTIGRYVQADPLGFVDGPSVYGYVKGRPHNLVDPTGSMTFTPPPPPPSIAEQCAKKDGTCSCSIRDTNTTTGADGQPVSCEVLHKAKLCPERYTGTGSDSASCQKNARDSAVGACKGCLGHCLFRPGK